MTAPRTAPRTAGTGVIYRRNPYSMGLILSNGVHIEFEPATGIEVWSKDGFYHRGDGPAVSYHYTGDKYFYFKDRCYE